MIAFLAFQSLFDGCCDDDVSAAHDAPGSKLIMIDADASVYGETARTSVINVGLQRRDYYDYYEHARERGVK